MRWYLLCLCTGIERNSPSDKQANDWFWTKLEMKMVEKFSLKCEQLNFEYQHTDSETYCSCIRCISSQCRWLLSKLLLKFLKCSIRTGIISTENPKTIIYMNLPIWCHLACISLLVRWNSSIVRSSLAMQLVFLLHFRRISFPRRMLHQRIDQSVNWNNNLYFKHSIVLKTTLSCVNLSCSRKKRKIYL